MQGLCKAHSGLEEKVRHNSQLLIDQGKTLVKIKDDTSDIKRQNGGSKLEKLFFGGFGAVIGLGVLKVLEKAVEVIFK